MTSQENIPTTYRAGVEQFVSNNLRSIRRYALVCATISALSIFGSIKTKELEAAAPAAVAPLVAACLTRLRVREIDDKIDAYTGVVSRVGRKDPSAANRRYTIDAFAAAGGGVFAGGVALLASTAERVAEGQLDNQSVGAITLAGLSCALGAGLTSPSLLNKHYVPMLDAIEAMRPSLAALQTSA
jgi:hypothetical protein